MLPWLDAGASGGALERHHRPQAVLDIGILDSLRPSSGCAPAFDNGPLLVLLLFCKCE